MRFPYITCISFILICLCAKAQDVTTVKATDNTISENLDLKAVASVFGESKDLEDFEKRLNDPKTQLSNLDLNEDGEVDYLRVLEISKDKTHVVTIQAVIGNNEYQDVAVIDVDKDNEKEGEVQVVGDVSMYGPDYIVTTVYVQPPVIWLWFWGPYYRPWRSPFYWGYYPSFYRPWRPYPVSRYQKNVHVHINVNNTYNRTTIRKNTTAVSLQKQSRKSDFSAKNKNKSSKNSGISTGKKVNGNWKPQEAKNGNKSAVKTMNNKATKNKSTAKPAAKPAAKTKKPNTNTKQIKRANSAVRKR